MYPDKPMCHEIDSVFKIGQDIQWQIREAKGTYGAGLRHCDYCGSLHPEDLLKVLDEGATLELADLKYGWPHKFYVNGVSNPSAGKLTIVGSSSYIGDDGERVEEKMVGMAPETLMMKFYNIHLKDLLNEPELEMISGKIMDLTGVRFANKEGKLFYMIDQRKVKPNNRL